MKKLVFITAMLLLGFGFCNAQISDAQSKGNYIVVYNSEGKVISSMFKKNNEELVGVTSSFFVVSNGSYIVTFNENCKVIASMFSKGAEVRGAAGKTFTIDDGNWITTYDAYCKVVRSRQK